MYLPAHFAETRKEELHRLIAEHPLGILVVQGPHGNPPLFPASSYGETTLRPT